MPDRPAKPGPWLLLTGVAALGSVLAVVVTGDWGKLPHYGAALVALSLLIALVLAVWFGHRERRRLVILSIASLGLYLVQLASGGLVVLPTTPAGRLHCTLRSAASRCSRYSSPSRTS